MEARLEEIRKMAYILLHKGVPINVVAEAAELPVEEIKKQVPTVH